MYILWGRSRSTGIRGEWEVSKNGGQGKWGESIVDWDNQWRRDERWMKIEIEENDVE